MKTSALLFILCLTSVCVFGQSDPEKYSSTSNHVYEVELSEVTESQCQGFRPNVMTLSIEERDELARLILQYVQSKLNPNYNAMTQQVWLKYDIIAQHVNYNSGVVPPWHDHDNPAFFTWHRDYLQGLEQWLLNNGHSNFVPLPAWNPIDGMPTGFLTAVVPEIQSTPYITANGTSIPMGLNNVDPEELQMYIVDGQITCGEFTDVTQFADFILHGSTDPDLQDHNDIHSTIGGAMGITATSPAAALFWIFHAHVDNLYACYLETCENCTPPLVRISTTRDRCNLCFNTDLSTNASPVTIRFFSTSGVEIFPERDPNTGCITDAWRKANVKPGDKIIVRASSAASQCGTDEIASEYSFPSQYVSSTSGKYQAVTLCNGKQTQNRVTPNPVGNDGTFISIENLGEATQIRVSHTDQQTSQTDVVVENRLLTIGETYSIFVNTQNWSNGFHVLSFRVDDEETYTILTKVAE